MRKMALVACVAAVAAVPAFARSITGASFTQEGAETTVSVTFEAGESGDDHALYVAYDVQDRGATLAGWAAYQRVGRVAADATSATFSLLPSLTGRGYGICRVFLVESTYPFDTLIEAIRQTGTQYVDTGINVDEAAAHLRRRLGRRHVALFLRHLHQRRRQLGQRLL